MPINSKQKGSRGERELAQLLRDNGFNARRGQQFSGNAEAPDVVHNIPGIHIECKRTEKLQLYKAMEQATKDASSSENTPTVWHRQNNKEWLVILRAEDFIRILNGNRLHD